MKLPPWLWHLLRSRKTHVTAGLALCLLGIAAAAFYPLVNWWGAREFAKAAAEVKARGLAPPSRVLAVADLPDSFFRQPGFLAEVALPNEKRLGPNFVTDLLPKTTRTTADQARSARVLLAPLPPRREALIEAARRSTPLASAKPDTLVLVPKDLSLTALHLAGFLEKDAMLARIAGDHDAALESLEAYFRIARDLMETEVLEQGLPRAVEEMIFSTILRPRCAGLNEAQLIRLDTLLAGIDFSAAFSKPLRELPGECVNIHRESMGTGRPGPRKLPHGLFSTWNWSRVEFQQKADAIWRAWQPFGFYEVEMARRLRVLADLVDEPPPQGQWYQVYSDAIADFDRITFPLMNPKSRQHAAQFRVSNYLGYEPTSYPLHIVIARQHIAIERHRLRHGELPTRMEDLDPDLRDRLPTEPKHNYRLLPAKAPID